MSMKEELQQLPFRFLLGWVTVWMVVAVIEIEELQEMEQDVSGEGIEKGGDDEFSFGYVEFAMDIEFKDVSGK